MKITKQNYMLFVSLGLLFVFYNLIVFTIFGFTGLTSAFWASYVFTILAIVLNVIARMLIFRNRLTARDWLFGFPALRYGFMYLVLQLSTSIKFMIFQNASTRLAIVIQLVILGLYLFFVIACYFGKEHIDKVEEKVKEKVLFTKSMQVELQTVVSRCNDPIAQKFIKNLAEKIRLSDPMSHDSLFELEKDIVLEITKLKSDIEQRDFDAAKERCNNIELLVDERNMKCKILK